MYDLNFDDVVPIELPVFYGGKRYVLREPTEEAARQYRNALLRSTQLTDGKVSGVDGMADVSSLLVSLCLHRTDEEGKIKMLPDGRPDPALLVPLHVLKSWPQRVVKNLFEAAKEIGQLVEGQETKVDLEKQAEEINRKLDLLKNGDEGSAKNSPDAAPTFTGQRSS